MRSWQTPSGQPNPDNLSFYGNRFDPRPERVVTRGEWIAVEIMTRLNSSPEASDGEVALWINGELVGHYGPGTVRGYWQRDQFRTDPSNWQSEPFEGFRWRRDMQLQINALKLENYMSRDAYKWTEDFLKQVPGVVANTQQGTVWFDHFVVATEYIGPLAPVGFKGHGD